VAEYEYLISPNNSGWHTLEAMTKILAAWDAFPEGFGVPSVTISKRVKEDQTTGDTRGPRCGDMTTVSFDAGEHQYTCDRDPGHKPPHRDRQQKGTETVSWSRTRPTR